MSANMRRRLGGLGHPSSRANQLILARKEIGEYLVAKITQLRQVASEDNLLGVIELDLALQTLLSHSRARSPAVVRYLVHQKDLCHMGINAANTLLKSRKKRRLFAPQFALWRSEIKDLTRWISILESNRTIPISDG